MAHRLRAGTYIPKSRLSPSSVEQIRIETFDRRRRIRVTGSARRISGRFPERSVAQFRSRRQLEPVGARAILSATMRDLRESLFPVRFRVPSSDRAKRRVVMAQYKYISVHVAIRPERRVSGPRADESRDSRKISIYQRLDHFDRIRMTILLIRADSPLYNTYIIYNNIM